MAPAPAPTAPVLSRPLACLTAPVAPVWTVAVDWSNAKQVWSLASPFNCSEMLDEQAARTKAAHPEQRVWIYRNSILALPWLSAVRAKLNDPAYASWFMHSTEANATNGTDPKCGTTGPNGTVKRCTDLWHDPNQTPLGDCGPNIPCGEYAFDMRSANTSVNGQTMIDWFINDYVLGFNGSGHPAVSGYFFDGAWKHALRNVTHCQGTNGCRSRLNAATQITGTISPKKTTSRSGRLRSTLMLTR